MKAALGLFAAALVAAPALAQNGKPGPLPPQAANIGKLETVARFSGPMPTGVTVSKGGRIFVNFPRWGDDVPFTVAEIVKGRAVPYPNADINVLNKSKPSRRLVSVQSVVVDPRDRLWILDTGAPLLGPVLPGGAKLIGVNLKTNTVFKTINFPTEVVTPTTYLNDIRFDLRQGSDGVAYITDSGEKSANGIIVVDLSTGISRRRLADHRSVKAEPNFVPIVEGQPLMKRKPGQTPKPLAMGSDGIAISADGERLFYTPLASRRLYSVSTTALRDTAASDEDVAKTVKDHGDKLGGSDGLETDLQGRIYLTQYEHRAVTRRLLDGSYETVVSDPRIVWPDTLSVAGNGYLYLINNQLNRQKDYHDGRDLRRKPYTLLRVKIPDAGAVRLQ